MKQQAVGVTKMKITEGWKENKPYKVYEFETFEACAEFWMVEFLFNEDYKTKVIGKEIIAWELKEA